MRVWTVWQGSYSSRELMGIFSTLEKAETYRQHMALLMDGDIDDESMEYEIDHEKEPEKIEVCIYEDGSHHMSMWYHTPRNEVEEIYESDYDKPKIIKGYSVEVNWYPDEERLLKIARDRLAIYKARKEGL